MDAIFLLLFPPPLPPSLSLSRPVFSRQPITGFRDPLLNLQSVQETRALTYRSRARLRNTRDRSIASRSIESWIHVVFAGRSSPLLLLSRARFACDAVVDVVESTISPSHLRNLLLLSFRLSFSALHRHRFLSSSSVIAL